MTKSSLTSGLKTCVVFSMTKDNHIFIKNIYYMLSYAFTNLNQSNYDEIAGEEFENIHDLMAAILSKGIAQQLKQGLYKEYVPEREDLSVMRGKINMPGTIRHSLQHRQLLSCEFDNYSENNLLNQIIKTCVTLLLMRGDVQEKYKSILKKEMLFFSNVQEIEPRTIRWSSIRFSRNNKTYRMLISLCQFIIEGMLLTTEKGDYKLASFIDEQRMCRLYEKFILEYYSKEFPTLEAKAAQIDWAVDDGIRTMLPVMQSDIMLSDSKGKGNVLIIDAKYYSHTTQVQYDKHTLHSGNMYQIFAYVKNKEAELTKRKLPHKVSGMLLYAGTDEEIQPHNSYMMSGNRIEVNTLDLNQEFGEIKKKLNGIAEDYFGIKH